MFENQNLHGIFWFFARVSFVTLPDCLWVFGELIFPQQHFHVYRKKEKYYVQLFSAELCTVYTDPAVHVTSAHNTTQKEISKKKKKKQRHHQCKWKKSLVCSCYFQCDTNVIFENIDKSNTPSFVLPSSERVTTTPFSKYTENIHSRILFAICIR